jgi:hypothetical protein
MIAVFIFSFTACYAYKLPNNAVETTANETIVEAETTETATTMEADTIEPEITAAETTAAAETTVAVASDYNIGEKGPAGGLIFYINPNYEADGWKYLEAAPSDFPGNGGLIKWNSGDYVYVATGATGVLIGDGISNTQKIVNMQGEGNYAAKLCDGLTEGGYSDWFMPSKDELNLMYENLQLKSIGSFEPNYYWSSSEKGIFGAWFQLFVDGRQFSDYISKDGYKRVRAVRAF